MSSPNPTPTGALPTHPYISEQNQRELARLAIIFNDLKKFANVGIYGLQEKHAEVIRKEIRDNAPYDATESSSWEQGVWGNYHMKDHMERRDYEDAKIGKGQEVESEASYSGYLEYGTATHGVQYIFFRPAVDKGWKEYKKDAIDTLKAIYRQ
jgi:hypothetical protein